MSLPTSPMAQEKRQQSLIHITLRPLHSFWYHRRVSDMSDIGKDYRKLNKNFLNRITLDGETTEWTF